MDLADEFVTEIEYVTRTSPKAYGSVLNLHYISRGINIITLMLYNSFMDSKEQQSCLLKFLEFGTP